eukprot:TRINITY_DN14505_c0_g1_i5.p1 TRINITY_DN14505_c0_g1~~TRINITY_DN14505_c0_g1_i5.p1  ORF type:complete len:1047 (-),score=82.17 TRINITY_DN14505_c0_g1_i5:3425-6565(-)
MQDQIQKHFCGQDKMQQFTSMVANEDFCPKCKQRRSGGHVSAGETYAFCGCSLQDRNRALAQLYAGQRPSPGRPVLVPKTQMGWANEHLSRRPIQAESFRQYVFGAVLTWLGDLAWWVALSPTLFCSASYYLVFAASLSFREGYLRTVCTWLGLLTILYMIAAAVLLLLSEAWSLRWCCLAVSLIPGCACVVGLFVCSSARSVGAQLLRSRIDSVNNPFERMSRAHWAVFSLLGITALLVGSIVAWTTFTSRIRAQGGFDLDEDEPPIVVPQQRSVWRSDEKFRTDAVMQPGARGGTRAHLEPKLERMCCLATFKERSGKLAHTNALAMRGSYFLLNAHWVREMQSHDQVRGTIAYSGTQRDFDVSTAKFHPELDLCVVSATGPMAPDCFPLFSNSINISNSRAHVIPTRKRANEVLEWQSVRSADLFVLKVPGIGERRRFVVPMDGATQGGDCGAALMNEHGTAILGIHCAGDGTRAVFECLDIAWMNDVCGEFTAQGPFFLGLPGEVGYHQIGELHSKCPLRFEGLGDKPIRHRVIGTILDIKHQRFKTKVVRTRYSQFFQDRGFPMVKFPPAFGQGDLQPEWVPKRQFLLNASADNFAPANLVEKVAAHYSARISKANWGTWQTLGPQQTLYGVDGDDHQPPMRFNTSAGAPYCCPKNRICELVTIDGVLRWSLPVTVKERLSECLAILRAGSSPGLLFRATFKDEPVSLKKLAAGKIRIFQASCIEATYLVRKYFLGACSTFARHKYLTECMVGMNVHGPEWDQLHDHVFRPGWKVICGDYSNFDQNMNPAWTQVAWLCLHQCGDERGRVARRALIGSLVYPTVDFFGDLLQLNGTNPSGHSLTVIINSIVNSLYIRFAYLVIVGELDTFDEHVVLVTYGDDNMVSVSPDRQEVFHLQSIIAALASVGVTYTDASKVAVDRFFTPESECTFLKRSWVRDAGFWRAPLEFDSLCKMLTIKVGGLRDGAEVVAAAGTLSSFLIESFHFGQEMYERHAVLVEECLQQDVELLDYFKRYYKIMAWDELVVARQNGLSYTQAEESSD